MATMYCALCRRPVEARRQVGVGTAILAVFTAGLSLLAIPFYARRCAICKSAAVSSAGPDGRAMTDATVERVAELEHRLSLAHGEMEAASAEIERLTAERDFYRQLLGDPTPRSGDRPGGGTTG
jgi:hypothetical protein